MKRNEGTADRIIRAVIGILLLVGGYLWLQGTRQIVAYVIGIVAVLTSITGFCALYTLLKITTYKKK